jgi:DNA-binding LacI/PurR family transcriptional regulator
MAVMLEFGPTMQDVAHAAGVHVATVSRALRKRRGVSEDVRAKVQRIASELGYRTNPLVSALIRSRRNPHRTRYHATLGFLEPNWPAGAQSYRIDYRQMIEAAGQRAAAFGYRLEEFALDTEGVSAQRLSDILTARSIAGLVLPPLYAVQDAIGVEWERWPVVAVGYSQRIPVPRVVHNHSRAMVLALAKCREHERARIGLVLPRRVSEKVEDRWLAAYLLDQFRTGGVLPPLLLAEDGGQDAFNPWLAKHRPDAIIGLQHLTPIHRWLKEARVPVPEKIALITLDYREQGPKFAGIDQNYALLGGLAVEHLVNLVERNDRMTMQRATVLAVDGIWRDGPTLPLGER